MDTICTINRGINMLQKIKTKGRLLFTTDLHGEVDVLKKALHTLGFVEGVDTLVCAGDLIDRGSDSLSTLDFFVNDDTNSYHTVRGNHDVFAIENNTEDNGGLWAYNGGVWAFNDHTQVDRDIMAHKVGTLPYVIEVEHQGIKIGVVHASVPQDIKSWEEFLGLLEIGNKNLLTEIVWDREFVEYPKCNDFQIPLSGIDLLVHGHSVVREPLLVGNRWHIDTGLVYGKYLTVAELINGEMVFYKFDIMGEELC